MKQVRALFLRHPRLSSIITGVLTGFFFFAISSDKSTDWRIVWLYGFLGAAAGLGVLHGIRWGSRLKLPPPSN